jgi:hypothetical protein
MIFLHLGWFLGVTVNISHITDGMDQVSALTEFTKALQVRLSDPNSADCVINCQGTRLMANKYILTLMSDVFKVSLLNECGIF